MIFCADDASEEHGADLSSLAVAGEKLTICLSSEVESIISESVPFVMPASLRGPNDFMEGEDESPAPNATCDAAGSKVDENSSDYYNNTSHSFIVVI